MRVFEIGQLSLMDAFETNERQEARLLDELLSHIENIKFVRTQIDLSLPEESKVRSHCVHYLTEVLEELANLCYLLARKSEEHEYYLDKTRVKAYLRLAELRSGSELYDLASGAGSRLKSLLMRSEILAYHDGDAVKDIIHYLDLVKKELYDGRRD